jgi:hypothetical protein
MENHSNAKLREEIYQKAAARAEATVYTLGNTYLCKEDKREVEFWYQLPGHIMLYSFVIAAIWSVAVGPLSWSKIICIPLAVNIIVGLLNWRFYNRAFLYKLYLTILHSWVLYLVGFGTAAFLFFKGAIALAIISLVAPFGLLAFAEPHILIYAALAKKYRMHPKYAFFKRFYRYEFPFEEAKTNEIV